jgi:hypothetical protein
MEQERGETETDGEGMKELPGMSEDISEFVIMSITNILLGTNSPIFTAK